CRGGQQTAQRPREHHAGESRTAKRRMHEVRLDDVAAIASATEHLPRQIDSRGVGEMFRREPGPDADVEDSLPSDRVADPTEPLALVKPRVDSVVSGRNTVEESLRSARAREQTHWPPKDSRN